MNKPAFCLLSDPEHGWVDFAEMNEDMVRNGQRTQAELDEFRKPSNLQFYCAIASICATEPPPRFNWWNRKK